MKTVILTIAVALGMSAAPAFAYESHHVDDRTGYSGEHRGNLDRHVNHLNRMLEKVRWQVRHYRADWRIRREVDQIARETDHINHRFRSGDFNGHRLRGEIDRLHDRLHGIEERLHVRSSDFYRWD
jgi:hypothetical protein